MTDEVNLLDLVALSRITPDLVVEKFGGKINSSFFDGSNILGSLRLKNLVDFTANFPVQSTITVTETGKQLLADAAEKAKLPFDQVDLAIITQLQSGKRTYMELGSSLNLRPKDLAFHIYKLGEQQYVAYDIRNGNIEIMLTEKGLMQAKTGMPQVPGQAQSMPLPPPPAPQMGMPTPNEAAPQVGMPSGMEMAPEAGAKPEVKTLDEIEETIRRAKNRNMMLGIAGVVIVVVVIAVLFITHVI